MTSEEPKHPDTAGPSSEGQRPKSGNGDKPGAESVELDDRQSTSSRRDDDRWNDSDIDAAVGVLERPSQPPVSIAAPNGMVEERGSDNAAPRDGLPAALSASSVEKSRRGGSDSPSARESSPAIEPAVVSPAMASHVMPDKDAVGLGATSHGDRNQSSGPDEAGADENTQYFDPASRLPAQPPTNSALSGSVPRQPDDAGTSKTHAIAKEESEEATQYFERPAIQSLSTSRLGDVPNDDAEEATQFFERGSDGNTDNEEPTQFLDRASHGGLPQALANQPPASRNVLASQPPSSKPRRPPASQHFPAPGQVPQRASSISLGKGVALLSAETTEPPPVVATPTKAIGRVGVAAPKFDSLPGASVAPRPMAQPPRPEPSRKGLPGHTPSNTAESVAASDREIPTRRVSEANRGLAETAATYAGSKALTARESPKVVPPSSGTDAEPMSERSNDGAGGEIDLPAQGLTGVTAFSIAPRPGSAGFEEEVWLDPFAVRALRRWLRVTLSCVVAALILAPIEAHFAQHTAADRPGLLQLTLGCAGLLVPVAMLLAVVVVAFSMLLHPDNAPSIGMLPQKLRPTDVRRKARLAVILLAAPMAMCCWIVAVARASLPLLGSNAPASVVGTLLAAVAVGFGLLLAAPVLAVARYAGVRLRQNPPDPIRWGLAGAVLGALPLVLAIALGPTSGAGSVLAVFGVFRRAELDLRGPGMLLAIGLTGYLLPSRLVHMRMTWALSIALLPLGLTYRAAARGLETRSIALAIERGAPVSRTTLARMRRLVDRDHDGFSKYFGGGDCDDRNRDRNPGQEDLPGNGIDEDCSGTDSVALVARAVTATPLELLREGRASIPDNLNLIFIIVDTMRADTIFHPKHVTPRLDELAERSVVVSQAYSPASYTGKSVGPILIGKHSSETHRDFGHFSAFSKKDTFIQQRLQLAGIRTVSVQGYWYFYQSLYGFDRGFDVVDSAASTGTGYVEGDRTSTSERLTERILHQLDTAEVTSNRFFIWAQYTDPHYEYVSHPGFDFGSDSLSKYHGEVAFVDHHVGRIIDMVRSKPWGARTAIVITSDHGECFGEHGMIRHGFELWEPLVRVPLIIYVPGIEARRVQSRRSLIDLVPTMLDLLQIAVPEVGGNDFLSGQSLLPEMLGIKGSDEPRPLLVDMAQGPFTQERQAFFDGDFKLIAASGRPVGLYNIAQDADEKRDLLDEAALRERVVGAYRAYKKSMHVIDVRAKP